MVCLQYKLHFFTAYATTILFFPILRTYLNSKFYIVLNIIALAIFLIFDGVSLYHTIFKEVSYDYILMFSYDLPDDFDKLIYFKTAITGSLFASLVLVIGLITNVYILNYFKGEGDEIHFSWLINGFVASMLLLLYSENFFAIFIGWEFIGLTSFFLINFWHYRRGTLKSAFKAFSFNLYSDISLLASLVCFFLASGVTSIEDLFHFINFYHITDWRCLLLFLGAILLICACACKSVQLVAHLWLPDSMEAPVPASALIHSATLVSAGIYLVIKFNFLFKYLDLIHFLSAIGAVTAAYGGLTAASQTDVKKLLAYSTMSHCGFMWIIAAIGNVYILVLYLFLHGFFKASSFYCCGSIIRFYKSQDARLIGNSHLLLRLDSFFLIFCSANLAGLPFTIGLYYKAFFLDLFVSSSNKLYILAGFASIGLLSSIVYFFQLTYFILFDKLKDYKLPLKKILDVVDEDYSKVYQSTPVNHVISIILIIIFSILFCVFLYHCVTDSCLSFEQLVTAPTPTEDLLVRETYGYVLVSFYCFYVIVLLYTAYIFYINKLFGLELLLSFLYFSFIIFNLF